MPVLSFANPVPVPASDATAAPAPTGALVPAAAPGAVAAFAPPASQISGDLSGVSISPPRLELAQKTSKCVEINPGFMGKFVFDKTTQLGAPSDPKAYLPDLGRAIHPDSVLCIVAHVAIEYKEETDFDSGIIPTRWKTAAEARASGLPFREVGIIDLLIATDVDHEQSILIDGLPFLRARIYVEKAAFRNVAGIVIRDAKSWLNGDTCSGFYELVSVKMAGKNTYWAPSLKTAGKTPEALRAAIKAEFGV